MSAAFVVEAVDAIMSAALANLDGLEVVELLSPARSAFGIAFDLTDQFKSTPRTGVQSQARARLEGYVSTPVKEGQPKSPAGDSLPRLLSEGRAAKLHIENEAKRQAAECARAKEVERARSLSDWLKGKVSHALEKRKDLLAEVSQKAKKHAEAVEGTLRRVKEAEEHRREELKAKLERKTGSNVSGKVSAGLQPPAGAALKRFQPPARAGGEAVLSPRPLSEPELQSGWVIITEATEQAA
ncbi:unnamed protein product [Prorocentrum cordatum]|uniref:Uncharacterized protein n=1 Tax=Prorocentrum cordatum TaxID=2364126 RepID=A0ABN9Y8N0_9DINO|nr:unnamed protein product [Polarella glacialis]